MACPFFMPTERILGGDWPYPARLPLGAGWNGQCWANAAARVPSEGELRDCNLGYAKCEHLPEERQADAVRFAVAAASGDIIVIRYACEREHRPGGCGMLEFNRRRMLWATQHPNPRLQKMAECFVRSWLDRASG